MFRPAILGVQYNPLQINLGSTNEAHDKDDVRNRHVTVRVMAPTTGRRVTFGANETIQNNFSAPQEPGEKSITIDEITPAREPSSRKRSRGISIEEPADHGKRGDLSLFQENQTGEGLTAFDIEEELAEGDKLTDKDGVIPKALADLAVDRTPSVSSSSGDERTADPEETKKERARERKMVEEEGDWSDDAMVAEEEKGIPAKRARTVSQGHKVAENICRLALRLQVEETPAKLIRRYGRTKDRFGIEAVTELCQELIEDGGISDVYEMRREPLLAKGGEWKLRWENDKEQKVHGPFDAGEMRAWGEGGYFSQPGNKGVVQIGDGEWWPADRLFPRPTT